jgi:hypothetical protein
MSVLEMMSWLQHRPFAVDIAESTWLFPGLETLHVLAITLVVGSVSMMDLRLLGLGRQRPVSQVIANSLPWTWSAFGVALIAGSLLFCSKAVTYYGNLPFRIKIACMMLAGLNMIVFHSVTRRGSVQWEHGAPPLAARLAGGISITLWITIVAMGRWIGFTT